MGKSKKTKQRKNNLLKRPSKDEEREKVREQQRQEKVLPVIQNLKSVNFRDRIIAISALNSMIDEPQLRKTLLKEKLLQIVLSHTLSDQSQEIVAEGFGLLRNVILEEGRDPAVYLFRQNILHTISSTMEKLKNVWTQTNKLEKLPNQDRAVVREFIENVIGLCSGLALADNTIFDGVVNIFSSLIPFLSLLLESKSSQLIDTVLEFLYILTEEPNAAAEMLNSGILTIGEYNTLTSTTYRLGIEYNLLELGARQGGEKELLDIMHQLYKVVSEQDLSVTVPSIPDVTDPKELKEMIVKSMHTRAKINAAQVAFELFASIMETISRIENVSSDITDFILNKIAPLSIQALQYPNFTLRASSTLNNLGWTMIAHQVDWSDLAQQVWSAASKLLSTEAIDILTSVVGLLSAVAQAFNGQVPVEAPEMQALIQRCLDKRPAELNTAFDDSRDFMDLLQALLPLVCSVGSQNADVAVMAADLIGYIFETPTLMTPQLLIETLNCLYEIFGDNEAEINAVYLQREMNAKLQRVRPDLKRTIRGIDKHNHELMTQADEALMNLDRFIDYKAS